MGKRVVLDLPDELFERIVKQAMSDKVEFVKAEIFKLLVRSLNNIESKKKKIDR